MKRIFLLVSLLVLCACESERTNRNPYLQEVGFSFELNLNLPLYSPLTNLGSVVLVTSQEVGTRGAFVIKSGIDTYSAFEASCPNHPPNDCSTMSFSGQVATCSCEDYEYSLFTGQMLNRPDDGNRYYDMLNYRTSFNGNSVRIFN
ncbi:hypothetical protein ACFQZJ_16035 [Maribacter chungangensis]|uniref:Rieske domain-containing protein n=1 Tax=Maribacter chungangensis TaxID=1069117 RepID=A0ABW3B709_9FLAO